MHQLHTTLTTLLVLSISLIYIATAEATCVTFSNDLCKTYVTPEKCLEVAGCTWEESYMSCTGRTELKCYNDPIRIHCNLRGCSEKAEGREEELLKKIPSRRLRSYGYYNEEDIRRIQTIYIIVYVVIFLVVVCVLGCYFWNRQRRIEANRPPPNEGMGGVPVVQNPQYYSEQPTAATFKASYEADRASV